jgi:ABC-2 type transport system permease protein
MSLLDAIAVEWVKLLRQRRTYLALGAIVLIEAVVLFVAYYQGRSILDTLLDQLKDSFYFSGDLLNGNLITYLLLNSLWFHLPLVLMIVVSGIFTSEYEEGTIRTLVLQGGSRRVIVRAKFVLAILFTLGCVGLLAVTAFVFSYVLFGTGDLVVYFDAFTFFPSQVAFKRLLWAFLLGSISMVFYSLVSLTLAIWLRTTIKTWIVAAVFLIVSNMLVQLDLDVLAMPHWFYVNLNNNWQLTFLEEVPWNRIGSSVGVMLAYCVLLMALGERMFIKRDIG